MSAINVKIYIESWLRLQAVNPLPMEMGRRPGLSPHDIFEETPDNFEGSLKPGDKWFRFWTTLKHRKFDALQTTEAVGMLYAAAIQG